MKKANIINKHSALPAFGNAVSRTLGNASLGVLGWKIAGELPDEPKVVAIAYPHTSNWDFIIGLSVMLATGLKGSWIAKAEMFNSPLGGIWKKLGGIPIVRGKKLGAVDQQITAMKAADKMFLLLEPEGTRGAGEQWKTGFYHIATGAGVPIQPVTWDYSSKTISFLPLFHPTGDIDADVHSLMLMGKDCQGKFPDRAPWQKTL